MSGDLVLIAEDDDDLRELLCSTLESAGYRVIEAPDGDAAARLLATTEPGAMITDVGMPGVNGVQLCRLARDTPAGPEMAILMVSGDADPDAAEMGLAAGADRYLTKPVSSRGIVAALRRVLTSAAHESGTPGR